MARPLRIEYPDAYYHVMNRGAGRKQIFHDEEFYGLFLELLEDIKISFKVEIHAYCLMGNHYHLLIKTPLGNLSRVMKHLNGVYTLRHNRLLKRDGALFRGRYKAILVDVENYLLHVSRYIHLNPVEANLVEKPEDYPWSSFQYYCQVKKRVDWLNYTDILNRFNIKNKRDSYKEFVYEGIDSKTNKIYNASKMVPIFGEDLFCQKIKEKLKITTHQEIPQTKELSTYSITKDKVVKEIAKYYRCSEIDIISGSNKRLKKIAVYFCERLTNHSQKEIGHFFSDISYSAISQISRRIKLEIEKDSRFKKEINGLGIILSNVKT